MAYRNLIWLVLLLCAVSAVSCSGAAVPPTSAPTAITVPTVAPTQVAVATSLVAALPTATTAATPVPPTSAPTVAATLVKPTPPPTSASAGSAKPGTFGKADVDKIFPPGKGQDLVFQACVNCHNWVPIVLAGFDENGWKQNQKNHRNRVSSLSDADFEYLYQYLEKTFPAGHPVPTNIPDDLLKEWTSY